MATHSHAQAISRSWAVGLCLVAGATRATEPPRFVFEGFPPDVLASKQQYERQLARVGPAVGNVPFHLIVPKLQRWTPGQTVRVAFNGGTPDLHSKIAAVAQRWVTVGKINLTLSFTDSNGKYRTWTTSDATYAGEIRVAFVTGKRGGNWSHVGTDSNNANLIGGISKQASMNLGGFDVELPPDWEGVVLHEFGHALGFEHEHQSPSSACDFRFDDDPGYKLTTDSKGWRINDGDRRRPGLYTFLGGYSNFWPPERVDANLKAIPVSSAFLVGSFDNDSVMKYLFPHYFFVAGEKSPCYSALENRRLSSGDVAGAQRAYPFDAALLALQNEEKRMLLTRVRETVRISRGTQAHATSQLRTLPVK